MAWRRPARDIARVAPADHPHEPGPPCCAKMRESPWAVAPRAGPVSQAPDAPAGRLEWRSTQQLVENELRSGRHRQRTEQPSSTAAR